MKFFSNFFKKKKKVFVSFLTPYDIKFSSCPHTFALMKQISHFDIDEIVIITHKERLACVGMPLTEYADKMGLSNNKIAEYKNYKYFYIDKELFTAIEKQYISNNLVFRDLLTKRYKPLEHELSSIFKNILIDFDIVAILAWCNSPSLTYIAKKYSLPIVHNEMGSLRAPLFFDTFFFDFKGVNGFTEAESRYIQFKKEMLGSGQILDLPEIISLIGSDILKNKISGAKNTEKKFEIGVALQIEDDSNILAYANGLTSFDLINIANKFFGKDNVLIRKHPFGHLNYVGKIDESESAVEFIAQCKRVITINSSLGLESVLLGVPTLFLGDSPFKFLSSPQMSNIKEVENISDEEMLLRINFSVFNYLVPYSLLYDMDYYTWRLKRPSEKDIFNYTIKYYKDLRN